MFMPPDKCLSNQEELQHLVHIVKHLWSTATLRIHVDSVLRHLHTTDIYQSLHTTWQVLIMPSY